MKHYITMNKQYHNNESTALERSVMNNWGGEGFKLNIRDQS